MYLPGSGPDPFVSSSTRALNTTRSNVSSGNPPPFSQCTVSRPAGASYARPTKDLEREERVIPLGVRAVALMAPTRSWVVERRPPYSPLAGRREVNAHEHIRKEGHGPSPRAPD